MINWGLYLQENAFFAKGRNAGLISHLDAIGNGTYDHNDEAGNDSDNYNDNDNDNVNDNDDNNNDHWENEEKKSERGDDHIECNSRPKINLYQTIDELQAHLSELEEPLPTMAELTSLRDDLQQSHKKTMALWKEVIDKEEEELAHKQMQIVAATPAVAVAPTPAPAHVVVPEVLTVNTAHSFKQDLTSVLNNSNNNNSPLPTSPLKSWTPRQSNSNSSYMSMPTLSEICEKSDLESSPSHQTVSSSSPRRISKFGAMMVQQQELKDLQKKKEEEEEEEEPTGEAEVNKDFVLEPACVKHYGSLFFALQKNPKYVLAVALSLSNVGERNEFVKIFVHRVGSSIVTSAEEVLLPIVRAGVGGGEGFWGVEAVREGDLFA